MVISDLIIETAKQLTNNARFEAEQMVMSVMNLTRTELVLGGKMPVMPKQRMRVQKMTERRLKGEPLQYILGECEFMSLNFYVERGVLIPRSDTEILVETVLDNIDNEARVLDICAGSGCIGISMAYYREKTDVDLIDISDKAVEIAEKNIIRNNVGDRVKITKMDILTECPNEKYDIIVSNPPYIETDVIDTLQTEVKNHEPLIALDGGKDGLIFYRRIIQIAPNLLNNKGILVFEIGYNQGKAVLETMRRDFEDLRIIQDLNRNDRVVIGTLKG